MDDKREFLLEVVSPRGLFFEGKASMLELRTDVGNVGIYFNHEPAGMRIIEGSAVITSDGRRLPARFGGGFARVTGDRVTVLVQTAEWLTDTGNEK